MKTYSWIIGALLLLSTTTASASNACCYDFNAYIDYLYWKVCRTDLNYTIGDDKTGYVNPNYDSGYRIGGNIICDCWDLGIRYTSYDTHAKRTAFALLDSITFDIELDVVDIDIGYRFHFDKCCSNLRPFIGAKLGWVDEVKDFSFEFIEVPTHDRIKAKIQGYGLNLGLEGDALLTTWCCCSCEIPIRLVGRVSSALLDTTRQAKREDYLPINRKPECLFVQVNEAFLGLDFALSRCGEDRSAHLQVGYEVQQWGHWREFTSSDELASLGFGGLVVRFGAAF